MACCGSKFGAAEISRYPKAVPNHSKWARAPGLADQFPDWWAEANERGDRVSTTAQARLGEEGERQEGADDAFTYSGANLAACQFPLGGFGTGYVILGGDGTLQAYNIVNQVREETEPMHCMPAGFFAVSAAAGAAGGGATAQSVLLASPETYTTENCALPPTKPARVSPASVARLEALPGIQSLQLTGR